MRREVKHERATHALSNGLMAGVYYAKLDIGVITLWTGCALYLSMLFKCLFLAAACPSTWGTKCSMFTKPLSRETTTTCSYDKALDCRDRLCLKPNSHSGNTVNYMLPGMLLLCLALWQLYLHWIGPGLPLISVNNNSSLHSSSNQKCTQCAKSLEHLAQAAQVSPSKELVSLLAPPSPPGCSAFSDHMGLAGHWPKLL